MLRALQNSSQPCSAEDRAAADNERQGGEGRLCLKPEGVSAAKEEERDREVCGMDDVIFSSAERYHQDQHYISEVPVDNTSHFIEWNPTLTPTLHQSLNSTCVQMAMCLKP